MPKYLTLLALLLSFYSTMGHASVKYSFSTGMALTRPFGPQLDPSAIATGSFIYDSSAPISGNAITRGFGNANSHYGGFYNIIATVGSFKVSDPIGNVIVGNDMNDYPGALPGQDWLGLNYDLGIAYGSNTVGPVPDPARPRDLNGFVVGDYSLFNVRMFWFEGVNLPDFLSDGNLPNVLPNLNGRLVLDFVLTESPDEFSYINSIFFDGLAVRVEKVPEPGTLQLLALGLLIGGRFVTRSRPPATSYVASL